MTAVYYADLTAFAGRFKLEARSADNAKPRPGPFQKGFAYTLFDGDAPLWTVRQKDVAHASPHELYLSDEGWSVVRTHGLGRGGSASLVVLDPRGRRTVEVDLLRQVFVKDRAHEVESTSAGSFWTGASMSCFVPLSGRPHFAVRTWTGRRIVLDLERGQLVPHLPEADEVALRTAEAASVRSTLEGAAPLVSAWSGLEGPQDRETLHDVVSAITHAGLLGLRDAAPLVRAFEGVAVVGSWRDCATLGCMQAAFQVRPVAALALRRLGEEPSGFGNHIFYETRTRMASPWDPSARRLEVPDPVADREGRVRSLTPGTSVRDVLALLGAPDAIGPDGWEYDLGGEDGRTLRLRFGWWRSDRVKAIDELRPPTWVASHERERGLARFA